MNPTPKPRAPLTREEIDTRAMLRESHRGYIRGASPHLRCIECGTPSPCPITKLLDEAEASLTLREEHAALQRENERLRQDVEYWKATAFREQEVHARTAHDRDVAERKYRALIVGDCPCDICDAARQVNAAPAKVGDV